MKWIGCFQKFATTVLFCLLTPSLFVSGLSQSHHSIDQNGSVINQSDESSTREVVTASQSKDSSIHYTGTKHKYPGFTDGTHNLETLAWAVKIEKPSTPVFNIFGSSQDKIAEDVALEVGLQFQGQIGHLDGVYLFVAEGHNEFNDHLKTEPYHRIDTSSWFHKYRTEKLNLVRVDQTESFRVQHINQAETSGTSNDNYSSDVPVHQHWVSYKQRVHDSLDAHPQVAWYTHQSVRRRSKRAIVKRKKPHRKQWSPWASQDDDRFDDPMYSEQWHLSNNMESAMDINVTGIWDRGITGKGVVAVVVDDGLEWTVPDIKANYVKEGSWDLNSNDDDPLPDSSNAHNHHGTRCAGEIAAATNKLCGVGVAYEAGIAGIRVLDGPMTDSLEATAFTKQFNVNDVYSCSWGPDDDGKTVDGPHHLASLALRHGVDYGRQGYGSIYVVASGNGGQFQDNCNYDGYANSIYTLTIGAVNEMGEMPYYAEECASMLAVTFSSGVTGLRSIVTTDWKHHDGTGCTTGHTGTSAAAPLAAGMVALALQARPCLTWRDIQHMVALTAVKVDIDVAHWQRNAAGLHHSHKHGFGLMDAWRLVNAAKVWEPVPWMTVYTAQLATPNDAIHAGEKLTYTVEVTSEDLEGYSLETLEYIQVTMTVQHPRRGDLEVQLYCPSGTVSVLGAQRPHDDSDKGFKDWTFSTVRCWAEEPRGIYKLILSDHGEQSRLHGNIVSWQLKLFGSRMTFDEFQERMKTVEASWSGEYLDSSYNVSCPPPPQKHSVVTPISDRLLKILVLSGAFALFMAVYETLEYAFCYNDEKDEQSKLKTLYERARDLMRRHTSSSSSSSRHANEESGEGQSLLTRTDHSEMIPLDNISTNPLSSDIAGSSHRPTPSGSYVSSSPPVDKTRTTSSYHNVPSDSDELFCDDR